MAVVHVPMWTIETAHDVSDGGLGPVTHYYTRAHCLSSFWWALDNFLRYDKGGALPDPGSMDTDLIRRCWWTQVPSEDNPDCWEYRESQEPYNSESFPVSYVLAEDVDPQIQDVCWACAKGNHDGCQVNFHRRGPVELSPFGYHTRRNNKWTGQPSTDWSAFAMSRDR